MHWATLRPSSLVFEWMETVEKKFSFGKIWGSHHPIESPRFIWLSGSKWMHFNSNSSASSYANRLFERCFALIDNPQTRLVKWGWSKYRLNFHKMSNQQHPRPLRNFTCKFCVTYFSAGETSPAVAFSGPMFRQSVVPRTTGLFQWSVMAVAPKKCLKIHGELGWQKNNSISGAMGIYL